MAPGTLLLAASLAWSGTPAAPEPVYEGLPAEAFPERAHWPPLSAADWTKCSVPPPPGSLDFSRLEKLRGLQVHSEGGLAWALAWEPKVGKDYKTFALHVCMADHWLMVGHSKERRDLQIVSLRLAKDLKEAILVLGSRGGGGDQIYFRIRPDELAGLGASAAIWDASWLFASDRGEPSTPRVFARVKGGGNLEIPDGILRLHRRAGLPPEVAESAFNVLAEEEILPESSPLRKAARDGSIGRWLASERVLQAPHKVQFFYGPRGEEPLLILSGAAEGRAAEKDLLKFSAPAKP
jgi:hypothetical protein